MCFSRHGRPAVGLPLTWWLHTGHAAEPPWLELVPLFDDTWFIDCDLDVAMERVRQRQIADGRDPDIVRRRVETNDRPNAELIAKTRRLARMIVPSRPFRNSQDL